MSSLLLGLLLAGPASAADLDVALAWMYEGIPGTMTVHEASGENPLWETATAAALKSIPAGKPFPGQVVRLKEGETRRAVLVYHNATDKPVRFFAAPHSAAPARVSLGFKFKCLCVNHVYAVPPGQWWYRVVELRAEPGAKGGRLELTHQLVSDGTLDD